VISTALSNKRKKDFFFEKKKQETFALALSPPDACLEQLARNQTDKSFLVLFFQKEQLFCISQRLPDLSV
jgi:hypothetical protein